MVSGRLRPDSEQWQAIDVRSSLSRCRAAFHRAVRFILTLEQYQRLVAAAAREGGSSTFRVTADVNWQFHSLPARPLVRCALDLDAVDDAVLEARGSYSSRDFVVTFGTPAPGLAWQNPPTIGWHFGEAERDFRSCAAKRIERNWND